MLLAAGYKISLIKLLFPLPETPVIAVITPIGMLTSTFFKLFCFAPLISMKPFSILRLFEGVSIFNFPLKYCPVMLLGSSIKFCTLPVATTSPPWTPAYGPMSTM